MTGLVRLYPKAWRDRYEDEFVELLEARPPTLGDVVDIARGAIDAHIHPNLEGTEPAPWTHRLPGLLALTAGLIWSGLTLSIALRPDPFYESGGIVGVFMFVAFFSLPGDYMAGHGRQIAIGIGACTACFVFATVAGWNPVGLGLMLLGYLIAICGPLVLAAIRAGIGPRGRWLLLAWAVLVPTVAAVGISAFQNATGIEVVSDGSPVTATLLLPYGLAWVLVGLRMTVRGAPTLVIPQPEVVAPQPEVHAA